MSRMHVASFNDVKIYNLSAGKSVPQWLSDRQKRNLAKDENYRRRIELIQDFEFPTASQRVKLSPDGEYVVVTGTYPPAVKVFEVQEMSLKFERRLTSDVVDFLILSEDFGKLVFLQDDRTICFHAPYGAHYNIRIPRFGRCLAYHPPSCDLYITSSCHEVYRLNLEEGRFQSPLETQSKEGVNKVAFNPIHLLLGTGGQDGVVEFWDSRSRERLTAMDMHEPLRQNLRGSQVEVTALEFDRDGLTYAVGTSSGHCLLYDLRSSKPLLVKEHQYSLPIHTIRFHDRARKVLSCDAKIVKIWDREGGERGKILTNVETSADTADLCVVSDQRGESGLMLMAGEQERVMAYYVPALGPAPRWCSFLDSITEEMEEEESGAVYEDYRFVTKQEVEELNASSLIGTPLLKGYMHGFFMDVQLYQRLKAVSEPFAFDEWRKKKLREKLEEKRASRISLQKKLPKVNQSLATRLLKGKKGGEGPEGDQVPELDPSNPLGDARFAKMFTSKDYEVDEEAEEFKLRNPSGVRRDRDEESDDELVVQDAFQEVEGGESSSEGEEESSSDEMGSSEEEVDDEEEEEGRMISKKPPPPQVLPRKGGKMGQADGGKAKGGRLPRFMELNDMSTAKQALNLNDPKNREEAKSRKMARKISIKERLLSLGTQVASKELDKGRLVVDSKGGGSFREYIYHPKGSNKGQGMGEDGRSKRPREGRKEGRAGGKKGREGR